MIRDGAHINQEASLGETTPKLRVGFGSTLLGGTRGCNEGKKTVSGFTSYKPHAAVVPSPSSMAPRSASTNSNALKSRPRYKETVAQLSLRSNPRKAYILMETNKLSLLPEKTDG